MLLHDWSPAAAGRAASAGPGPRRLVAVAPPSHPNDAAQARVFAELMRVEIAELDHLIDIAQTRWADRVDAGWGNARTPEPVLRLRTKRAEVQGFLDRLQARFAAD
ncbi:hypothetical protein OG976_04560 [Mycobacterium sp. NBC_00419]|uniref:hypothetical protein n=1 Tax=Mycobacterium sp. NBC_00419 TaxID=2975989 RepID=UPI002E1E44B8